MSYAPGLDVRAPANFRDLGGLRTEDGRQVRPGLIYRSEFPHWWRRCGPDLPLRTAIDLRRPVETELEDVDWDRWGVRCLTFSLGSGTVPFAEAHADAYLTQGEVELARAVSAVIAPDALPAHFFCAAGKDRTGLLALVVLSLLGVERDDILSDFKATADGIARVLDRLSTHRYYEQLFDGRPLEVFIPLEPAAHVVLDWLAERGGTTAWAVSHGMTDAEVEDFRTRVLHQPPPTQA